MLSQLTVVYLFEQFNDSLAIYFNMVVYVFRLHVNSDVLEDLLPLTKTLY
jgi:hypothetical protein